ncbi:MAG: acetate--CoA ligase family protein, partial [Deltaproteobacteria bacterium]|nr:acetate--CoA ligase family protein [Deltaproteobacteria bacterium]
VLYVPVIARGELARSGDGAALFGARPALAAVDILGRAAERIAAGLGSAPRTASAELAIDEARLHRQLEKLGDGRLGDHETKVLLAAYGVPITRQAVATTPSAAVKLARRAGYPVEVKPWGHDLPSEPAGCPVERNVTSDALVRQAFASVLAAAGRTGPRAADGAAVIIRETPPPGREVSASFLELASLGWTVVLDAPGAGRVAAPAPLRLADAQLLAAHVVASRAGDPEPDRIGLANLLRRASHLVVDLEQRLFSLELPRIVVGGRGARTLVVDASAELRDRSP